MKKITLKAWAILVLSLCGFAGANAQDRDLLAEGLNWVSNASLVSYNEGTTTIDYHYGGPAVEEWQQAGQEYATPDDWSAYDYLVVEFDASGISNPNPGDPSKIEIQVNYEGGANSKVSDLRLTAFFIAVPLDAGNSSAVEQFFVKSQYEGTIVLKSVYLSNSAAVKSSEIPLFGINNSEGPNAVWDYSTSTFTSYNEDWKWIRWNFENAPNSAKDFSNFIGFVLEYEEAEFGTQVIVDSGDGVDEAVEGLVGSTSITVPFDNINSANIKNIFVKLKNPGSVVLTKAYLITAVEPLPDFEVGTYDIETGEFTNETVNINDKFTFAIKVNAANFQTVLDAPATGDGGTERTLAFYEARYIIDGLKSVVNAEEDSVVFFAAPAFEFRMTRVEDTYIYYLEDYTPTHATLPLAAGTTGYIHYNALVAEIGSGFWWNDSKDAGATPGYAGSIPFTAAPVLGINDLAADDSAVTGYYSILGAKLSAEPASGIFIVKYANGKAVKVVK